MYFDINGVAQPETWRDHIDAFDVRRRYTCRADASALCIVERGEKFVVVDRHANGVGGWKDLATVDTLEEAKAVYRMIYALGVDSRGVKRNADS